jgi:hypothetical protein
MQHILPATIASAILCLSLPAQGNSNFPQFLTPSIPIGPGCGNSMAWLSDTGPTGQSATPAFFMFDPFLHFMGQYGGHNGLWGFIGLGTAALPAGIDIGIPLLHAQPCNVYILPDVIMDAFAYASGGACATYLPPVPPIITELYIQGLFLGTTQLGTYLSTTPAFRII